MENRSHALIAGLFTLFLGISAVAALWWFGGAEEESVQYIVHTRRNVTGLNPQASVRYRGIQVGKVKSIEIDPKDALNTLIVISIRKTVPITQGTYAKLETQGVTGIAHVLLEDNGDNSALRALGSGELLSIPMRDSLIQKLSDAGNETLQDAREFLSSANQMLNPENRRRISETLANLEATTANSREATAQLRQLLTPENIALLQTLLVNAGKTAEQAGPFFAEARGLVAGLQSVSEKLEVTLDHTANSAEYLAPRLNELSTDLMLNSRQLGRMLQMLEESPQSLIFGPRKPLPGPGEAGFVAPENIRGKP